MDRNLATRERLFCHFHAMLGNAREAAVQAGYPPESAAAVSAKLLGRREIQKECAHLSAWGIPQAARRGLERLAFGQINDAVKLLFCDEPGPLEISSLDLFLVSEIRRPKGGGLEIKFHDRLGALKLLAEMGDSTARENGVDALLTALEKGAGELRARGCDED